jgi:hypothetical protein
MVDRMWQDLSSGQRYCAIIEVALIILLTIICSNQVNWTQNVERCCSLGMLPISFGSRDEQTCFGNLSSNGIYYTLLLRNIALVKLPRFVERQSELLDGWGAGLQGVVWLVRRSRLLTTLWQPDMGTWTTRVEQEQRELHASKSLSKLEQRRASQWQRLREQIHPWLSGLFVAAVSLWTNFIFKNSIWLNRAYQRWLRQQNLPVPRNARRM